VRHRRGIASGATPLVKSAINWDDFRPFFTLRVIFMGGLVLISTYLRSGPGKIFIFFENILHNFFLF
jgi:hypothetical protein